MFILGVKKLKMIVMIKDLKLNNLWNKIILKIMMICKNIIGIDKGKFGEMI